ncbi:MAG: helix-turn-helix transcriptional regulator [Lachnospiraceae bacterium]|nr:helix-turn-helix transcriptional regulator [Lachnospiraceae bacterium]
MKDESRTTYIHQELCNVPMDKDSYQKFLANHERDMQETNLSSFFNDYLAEHPGLTVPEIIRRSRVSGDYARQIINGRRPRPSKYKLLALCIGAGMNIIETRRALQYAGCPALYDKDNVDAGIIICINNGCNNVADVQAFLIEAGEEDPFEEKRPN